MNKISFCTVCRGRLHHLRRTLPRNIVWNQGYSALEFVLLDYNSADGLEKWVKTEMAGYIKSGRLVYLKESSSPYFQHSHSRNLCFKMATGDIVCNIDADNFTGAGFAEHVNELFGNKPALICGGMAMAGLFGRIALRKSDFMRLGGYNESFSQGWGVEDWDLIRRGMGLGFEFIKFDSRFHIDSISHSNMEREVYTRAGNMMDSRAASVAMSDENIAARRFVANTDRENGWGCGIVERNFTETICVGAAAVRGGVTR